MNFLESQGGEDSKEKAKAYFDQIYVMLAKEIE